MLGEVHHDRSGTSSANRKQTHSYISLPKLQTSSSSPHTTTVSPAAAGHAGVTVTPMTASGFQISRQRSRPASPVLTSPMDEDCSKKKNAFSFNNNHHDGTFRQQGSCCMSDLHQSGQSFPFAAGTSAVAPARDRDGHPDASSSGTSSSRPLSRSQSRNGHNYNTVSSSRSRSRSPVTASSNKHGQNGNIGIGISRSTTPLLYADNIAAREDENQMNMFNLHSSSSFLLGSSMSSYTSLPNEDHSMVDLRESDTCSNIKKSQRQTYNSPGISNDRPTSIKHFITPAYLSHRIRELIIEVKANLSIGVPGEWRDLETGKWKVPNHLKAYVPLLIWVGVSVAFGVIVGVWHEEVFAGLDALSTYLKSQGYLGDFILYLCIFITTFPPLPLYSTLIFLSGYSFGLLEGFIISYAAALSGAVVVYLCSKVWLRESMERMLNKSVGLKKVLRAIERRPRLLWLIRLSPYPYNVMNVLLASSSTLSFSCYFWCTALALPKLMVHCSVGTTIRSFAESAKSSTRLEDGDAGGGAGSDEELQRELSGQRMKAIAGLVGILLCVGVFIYLLIVARRAVDELDDLDCLPSADPTSRSRSSTLEGHAEYQGIPEGRTSMAEYRPLSTSLLSSSRGAHSARVTGQLEGRKSIAGDGVDNTGRMMTQRHVFERQDSSMPYLLQDFATSDQQRRSQSMDLQRQRQPPPSYAKNMNGGSTNPRPGKDKKGKKSDDEEHTRRSEYTAGEEDEDTEGSENARLWNNSAGVVDRLESIAAARQQRLAR